MRNGSLLPCRVFMNRQWEQWTFSRTIHRWKFISDSVSVVHLKADVRPPRTIFFCYILRQWRVSVDSSLSTWDKIFQLWLLFYFLCCNFTLQWEQRLTCCSTLLDNNLFLWTQSSQGWNLSDIAEQESCLRGFVFVLSQLFLRPLSFVSFYRYWVQKDWSNRTHWARLFPQLTLLSSEHKKMSYSWMRMRKRCWASSATHMTVYNTSLWKHGWNLAWDWSLHDEWTFCLMTISVSWTMISCCCSQVSVLRMNLVLVSHVRWSPLGNGEYRKAGKLQYPRWFVSAKRKERNKQILFLFFLKQAFVAKNSLSETNRRRFQNLEFFPTSHVNKRRLASKQNDTK